MSEFRTMPIWEIQIEAIAQNCSVVIAAPNELQFDLDSNESYIALVAFWADRLCPRYYESLPIEFWPSKSGNRHAVITLPETLEVPERIALQAMGGSDPGREFAALRCHQEGSPHPVLLYKPLPKLLMSGGAL